LHIFPALTIIVAQNNMTNRRRRVLDAIDFRKTDQVPKDLGAMGSTGISCFAYPKLVEALGLPPRRPRVHDTNQMLALPDLDVLDALDCDVVTVGLNTYTNAFDEPDRWHNYDFGGRLPAKVMHPELFSLRTDGTVIQQNKNGAAVREMPPASYVFDSRHAGQPFDIAGELQRIDLDALLQRNAAAVFSTSHA
jgi:uroporphyrinogen decarboxylase